MAQKSLAWFYSVLPSVSLNGGMKNEDCCIGMESIEKRNKVKAIALCDVRK